MKVAITFFIALTALLVIISAVPQHNYPFGPSFQNFPYRQGNDWTNTINNFNNRPAASWQNRFYESQPGIQSSHFNYNNHLARQTVPVCSSCGCSNCGCNCNSECNCGGTGNSGNNTVNLKFDFTPPKNFDFTPPKNWWRDLQNNGALGAGVLLPNSLANYENYANSFPIYNSNPGVLLGPGTTGLNVASLLRNQLYDANNYDSANSGLFGSRPYSPNYRRAIDSNFDNRYESNLKYDSDRFNSNNRNKQERTIIVQRFDNQHIPFNNENGYSNFGHANYENRESPQFNGNNNAFPYAGFGSPGFGLPGFGSPGFGSPGFGYPGFGLPGLGYPSFGYPWNSRCGCRDCSRRGNGGYRGGRGGRGRDDRDGRGFDIDFRTIQRQTADANINDGGDDNRYFSDSGNTGNFNSGNVQN